MDPLLDESLLEGLTEEQRKEALAAAAAAKRAEERAAARKRKQPPAPTPKTSSSGLVYVPKHKRGKQKVENENGKATKKTVPTNGNHKEAPAPVPESTLSERERKEIQASYMGKSAAPKEETKKKSSSVGKKRTFRFQWDDTDDTFQADDLLYSNAVALPQPKKRDRFLSGHSKQTTIHDVRSKPIEQMTTRDWRIIRENYQISVLGSNIPHPLRTFEESKCHPALLDAITNVMKFKEPSPIQRQAIPLGMQQRDVMGIAETGSGKTVAFGLPLCHALLTSDDDLLSSVAENGPLAVILAPTRELALQIEGELQKVLSRCEGLLKTCPVVGGQSIQQQAQWLREGMHIVVGTPGRINECIEMAYMVLNQCKYVVLDEADRMVDMGFLPQVESILESMGEDEGRITAMFSATMPPEVERITRDYLRQPVTVSVGDKSSKNTRIEQRLVWLGAPSMKEKALKDQLLDRRFIREKVIVFVNEKKHADGIGRIVERVRPCVVLHGGKSQEQREANLETFRRGNGVVLVATDVAGRGLDIPDVAHVINYDLPKRSIESYTHRIGRTGRAGKDGVATSFITDEDEGIMPDLKAHLESTKNKVPERLARHPAANTGSGHGNLIF